MNKFIRTIGLVIILLVSGWLFSGCTPQTKTNQPQLSLTETNNGLDQVNTNQQATPTKQVKSQNNYSNEKGPQMKTLEDFPKIEAQKATVITNKGDIVIKLFRQRAPLTTANFLSLANEGFYDGVVFHRVINDFMAQVGDPKSKDPKLKAQWGTGGPGYVIADEFHPELRHDQKGVVSMANSGPNTGGSQFFITHKATPWLDDKHAVFGQVVSGLDVLDKIEMNDQILEIQLD